MALVPFRDRRAQERSIFDRDGGLFENVSVLERLDEVRKRIVRALLAVAVGTLLTFAFIDKIVAFLLAPAERAIQGTQGSRMIYTEPGEAFGLYIQVALVTGLVLALPFV